MLARVLNWGREPGPSTGALNLGPLPPAPIMVPNRRPQSEALTKGPKRRRKQIEFENIYPEKSQSEAFIHATALLDLLKAECTPGRYIKKKQLERMYAELCAARRVAASPLDGDRPAAREADRQEDEEGERQEGRGLPRPEALSPHAPSALSSATSAGPLVWSCQSRSSPGDMPYVRSAGGRFEAHDVGNDVIHIGLRKDEIRHVGVGVL